MTPEVRAALTELRHLVTCRCDPAWTDRRLHETHCAIEYAADLDVVERYIKEHRDH